MAVKGRNKRRQLECFDVFHNQTLLCDSQEECDFIQWCSEATQLSIINDYEYQPEPFMLFDAVSYETLNGKKRSLLQKHQYSPDFIVTFNPQISQTLSNAFKLSHDQFLQSEVKVYLDVKGVFQRNGSGRAFSLNQKWVYQKFGIYVQKLVPCEFFKDCGCPVLCFTSLKTKRIRSMYKGFQTISEKLKSC